jgi:hypothetical protein
MRAACRAEDPEGGRPLFATRACNVQVFAVLRPGGVWINQGPLLYHGKRGGPLLTSDELMLLLERRGFEVLEQAFRPCVYSQDDTSMCRSEYSCLYYVVRKRAA